jgi:hypothetical protein
MGMTRFYHFTMVYPGKPTRVTRVNQGKSYLYLYMPSLARD